MSVTTAPLPRIDDSMGKRRQDSDPKPGPGRPAVGKQFGVRLPAELQTSLEEIGEGMGLDLSSVMRMILTEQHGTYLQRVRQRRQQEAEASEG